MNIELRKIREKLHYPGGIIMNRIWSLTWRIDCYSPATGKCRASLLKIGSEVFYLYTKYKDNIFSILSLCK